MHLQVFPQQKNSSREDKTALKLMTTIYSTNGYQNFAAQDVITVRYAATEYEQDPQPGISVLDTYTKIWAKDFERFVELCESHADGKEVVFEEIEG